MLARFILRFVMPLGMAALVAMSLIRAQPYRSTDLRDFLAPPGCRTVCFLGLRPGVTTGIEARMLLLEHPWVADAYVIQVEPYLIRWRWNGQQPALFDPNAAGEVYINNYNLVTTVRVPTTIPYAAVWFELGAAETGYRLPARSAESGLLEIMTYQNRLYAINFITCPAYDRDFWDDRVVLYYSDSFIGLMNQHHDPRRGARRCA
jgi:hypothetical protein